MQYPKKIGFYLKAAGWLGILSYPLSRVFLSYQAYSLINDPEFTKSMIPMDGLTVLLDAPFNLALPVLCLCAATYLRKITQTSVEVLG